MSIIPAYTYTLTNGTTADANQVMSNFNTVLTNVNNNAATNGVNSDITQLTGLTTPLTVGQGGWGLGTLTANSLYVGNGTSTPTAIGVYTAWFRSFLAGLTLSNDGTTPNSVLDIAAGACIDSTNATLINLGAFTKSTGGSWASGTGSNGMGTGLTIANSTWYHVFAIINAGVADVYFDTSVSAANAPNGTTAFRRIGSFKTDSSAHILAFIQSGDRFEWVSYVAELANQATSTTPTTLTLNGVPPGAKMVARMWGGMSTPSGGAQSEVLIYDADTSPTINAVAGLWTYGLTTAPAITGAPLEVQTNVSAQIKYVGSTNSNPPTVSLVTFGWIDTRGQYN